MISAPELDRRFRFAADLVREAGALALRLRNDPAALGVEAKDARDFVTAADRAVEQLIADRIATAFGDDVLGEEFGGTGSTEKLWIVDPIDGTYNYIHGNPRWCVSLGFMLQGRPELGLIYAPSRDELYLGRRGTGATRNGGPLAVSGNRFLGQPLVEIGTSNRRPIDDYLATVRRLMSDGIETRRCGSGALGLAQVATGEIDGYFEHHINAWDVAAGIVIVTEAGGCVNDFFSGDGLAGGNRILACTPEIRQRLEALVDG